MKPSSREEMRNTTSAGDVCVLPGSTVDGRGDSSPGGSTMTRLETGNTPQLEFRHSANESNIVAYQSDCIAGMQDNDCHGYIFHLTKSGDVELDRLAIGVEYQDKSNVSRWAGARGDRRCRGNTWFVPYKTIQRRDTERPHPATFPVTIPDMCVRLHGVKRARRVLDPFMGLAARGKSRSF